VEWEVDPLFGCLLTTLSEKAFCPSSFNVACCREGARYRLRHLASQLWYATFSLTHVVSGNRATSLLHLLTTQARNRRLHGVY